MSDTVIKVENLGKKYIIGHQRQKHYATLRESISTGSKNIVGKLRGKLSADPATEEFWALKDVGFEIKQGDRVGIIGRNGAGKSTLLKILSRITEPTNGSIRIKGRVASLLEVGTGFHPELTGRENIFLNGAVLGMGKTEIQRKFDEIVDFAEVEKFLDTPVKRYSSGMYVRLAFAVAAHLEPEILIVDEVLAVGDTQFQKKCLGRMKSVAGEGRTVLFVSHNMAAINTLCSSGILLSGGQVVCKGNIRDCVSAYDAQNSQDREAVWNRPPDSASSNLEISQIDLKLQGMQPDIFLEVTVALRSNSPHKPAYLAVDISDNIGTTIMQAIPSSENYIADNITDHLVKVTIQLPPLIPERYVVSVWVGSHNTETIDWVKEAVMFEINDSPTIGRSFPHNSEHGYIVPASTIKILTSANNHIQF
jgi:lipopolysaccharide transport system ATP-binding protein